ncbi:MAG: hypothetical protein WBL65_20575 [Bryobacteraceae bacterium]
MSRANVSDGSGGYFTGFDCNFYHEAVYPFDLTSFMTNGGASLPENALVPGYIVWTTDASDVTNQTLTDPGAIKDVLDFDANILAGTGSSQVYVYWPGGPAIPTVATMIAAGFLVLPYNPSGIELFDPGDNLHTFTIHDNLTLDGPFLVSYAANPTAGESIVNLINTGANGAPLLGPGFGAAAGNTCVNVYTFDPGEELIACCSCLLTPDQVVNLGVNADLTIKTQTGVVPSSVTIKLLNTLAGPTGTATSCTNSAALAGGTNFPLAPGLVAYGTTPQQLTGTGVYSMVEHPFIPATLGVTGVNNELASITGLCASLAGNASGYGICLQCRPGALGAAKL